MDVSTARARLGNATSYVLAGKHQLLTRGKSVYSKRASASAYWAWGLAIAAVAGSRHRQSSQNGC